MVKGLSWLFSQSSSIKVLSPPSLVEEMKKNLDVCQTCITFRDHVIWGYIGERYKINYG